MSLDSLNEKLIRAHREDDLAALVTLYTTAADVSEKAGDMDAACFYLTHAYVFALDNGSGQADGLYLRLLQHDRVPVQNN